MWAWDGIGGSRHKQVGERRNRGGLCMFGKLRHGNHGVVKKKLTLWLIEGL